MLSAYALLFITIAFLLGSQANTMEMPRHKSKNTLPRNAKKNSYVPYSLTLKNVDKKYTANSTESSLITAVKSNDLLTVQDFFKDNHNTSNLRVDGCIMALHMALESKHFNIEKHLFSQQLIQNLLIQDSPIGLRKLFTLSVKYKYKEIILEILNDAKKFENIDSETIGQALGFAINNAADDLVKIFLTSQSTRSLLTPETLKLMLYPAAEKPYHETIVQLISEKKIKS